MNLIEQLGGYDKTKEVYKNCSDGSTACFMNNCFYSKESLELLLLQYRRSNNIFEKGDDIIFGLVGNGIMRWDDCLAMFVSQGLIRHATDAEIKAGRRL